MFENSGVKNLSNNYLELPKSLNNDGAKGLFKNCESLTDLPQGLFKKSLQLTDLDEFCYSCTSLTGINNDFILPTTTNTTKSMFYNCTSLSSLNDTFILPKTVYDCGRMFYNCSNLTKLPNSIQFPENITGLNCFCKDCISLTSIPKSIWPKDGFAYNSTIDIHWAFYNCSSLTGFMPYYFLWQADHVYWNPENAINEPYTFYNCTKLSNYSYIPINWGGLRK